MVHMEYTTLVSWILILIIIATLPRIVRSSKLDDLISPNTLEIIRAALIAYFIVSVIGVVAIYLTGFLSGLLFFLGK